MLGVISFARHTSNGHALEYLGTDAAGTSISVIRLNDLAKSAIDP